MHLKVGYFVKYTPIYRLTEQKKRFHVHNCLCGTVGAKIGNVHANVFVESGRKVLLVDCLIMKNIKYGENKHKRKHTSVFMHTKTPSVTIQGNTTAMRYRNDVTRSVLLLHILANLGMMLARDYASCHATRSTLVMIVSNNVQQFRWPAKCLDLNPTDNVLDLLKRSCTAAATKSH